MIRFGANKASSLTQVKVIDIKSNKTIGNFDVSSDLSIGVFGGSADEMIKTTEQIVNTLKERFLIKGN